MCILTSEAYSLCGNHMLLLALVEASGSLHADVVGLCRPAREHNLTWVGSDTVCYLLEKKHKDFKQR